jgi:hypothetical protein
VEACNRWGAHLLLHLSSRKATLIQSNIEHRVTEALHTNRWRHTLLGYFSIYRKHTGADICFYSMEKSGIANRHTHLRKWTLPSMEFSILYRIWCNMSWILRYHTTTRTCQESHINKYRKKTPSVGAHRINPNPDGGRWLVSKVRWEPQEEGMMSIAASLPLVVKPRFNRTSRRKPNFRRWCLLASWHSEKGRQINCLSACSFSPAAMWNLHTTQPRTLLPTYDEVVNLTSLL